MEQNNVEILSFRQVFRRFSFAAVLACSSLSVWAQGSLSFMGVPVVGATRGSMTSALESNSGTFKGGRTQGDLQIDSFQFPKGVLPVSIGSLVLIYNKENSLVKIQAKIPPGKFWEKESAEKSSEMLQLLESKYGKARKVRQSKTIVETMNEYLWFFGDGGIISLEEKGRLSGLSLSYINGQLESKLLIEKKRNIEDKF